MNEAQVFAHAADAIRKEFIRHHGGGSVERVYVNTNERRIVVVTEEVTVTFQAVASRDESTP